jgi:hypothetical protein
MYLCPTYATYQIQAHFPNLTHFFREWGFGNLEGGFNQCQKSHGPSKSPIICVPIVRIKKITSRTIRISGTQH